MATKVITLASNFPIKYRLSTSTLFTTLSGGVTHSISVQEKDIIEFKSASAIEHIQFGGDIKDIVVRTSELTSLANSFRDIDRLDTVEVHSSVPIVDMNSAFKNSGIKSFDIDTTQIRDYDSTFEGATRIEEIDINTDSAETMNATFSGSLSLQAIRHILPFNDSSITDILKGTVNLKELSGIDYTFVEDEGTLANSRALLPLGLHLRDKKPQVRRLYVTDADRMADPNYTFEMNYDFRDEDGSLGRSISTIYTDPSLSTESTDGYTFEMDYMFRNEDGYVSRSASSLDTSPDTSITVGYTFEMDYVFRDEDRSIVRSSYEIANRPSTDKDNGYTFEMDIVPEYTIIN